MHLSLGCETAPPPLARVESVEREDSRPVGREGGFRIVETDAGGSVGRTLAPADVGICDDCSGN